MTWLPESVAGLGKGRFDARGLYAVRWTVLGPAGPDITPQG